MPRRYVGSLVGKKISFLTIKRASVRSLPSGDAVGYICDCDCGVVDKWVPKSAILSALPDSNSRRRVSCGCLHAQRGLSRVYRRKYSQTTIHYYYCSHVASGKKRHNGFLEKSVWLSLVLMPCFYCGGMDIRSRTRNRDHLDQLSQEEASKYEVEINGIDRVDSSKGYTIDNCVSCCKQCNQAKMDYTAEEFKMWVKRVHDHLFRQEDDTPKG